MDKATRILYMHNYGYRSDEYGWEWAACQGCSWPDGEQLSRGAGYEPHYQHQVDLIREQIAQEIEQDVVAKFGASTSRSIMARAARIVRGGN